MAGGVYRLVRREFRWGDASTLQLEPRAGLELPPTMRIYALERSLSREERLDEVSAAASEMCRPARRLAMFTSSWPRVVHMPLREMNRLLSPTTNRLLRAKPKPFPYSTAFSRHAIWAAVAPTLDRSDWARARSSRSSSSKNLLQSSRSASLGQPARIRRGQYHSWQNGVDAG